jgi:hypothetical protein
VLSIIKGFQTPLKDEHKENLIKVILPLHVAKSFRHFQPEFVKCILEYISHDSNLVEEVKKNQYVLFFLLCTGSSCIGRECFPGFWFIQEKFQNFNFLLIS